MDQTQLNLPFEVVITKDGSPSLAFFKDGFSQMMHSTQGAFSETEFVYGKALDVAIKEFSELSILSVGLGFGYVELSTAVRALDKPTRLISYEKEDILRSNWMKFVSNESSVFEFHYQVILDLYVKKYSTTEEQIKSFFIPSQFILRESLELTQAPTETFNCILFDPFCAKFSPEFWQEDTLTHFIQKVSAPKCVFSTYAATGVLNRSLKAASFRLTKQKGFAGKRQSTLAIKGF